MIKDYLFKQKKEILYFVVSVWEIPGNDKDCDVNTDFVPSYQDALAYVKDLKENFGEHIKEIQIFKAKGV